MRIAFATLHFPSHLNSMIALACRVRERGHEVFFVGVADAEQAVQAAGMAFYAVAEKEFPRGFSHERDLELANLGGLKAVKFAVEGLCGAFDAIVRDCPVVLRRAGAQAAVIDQLGSGYSAAVRQVGLPLVNAIVSLPANPWPSSPPVMFGWSYDPGQLARLRNKTAHAFGRYLVRQYIAKVESFYRRQRIPFDVAGPSFGCSTLAQVSQTPAAFDFPNFEKPAWFHPTGPFDDGLSRPAVKFPWEQIRDKPIIYASMGTLQNGQIHVFRTIAEACAGLGYQLVLALGGRLTAEFVGPLPGENIIVNYAPQPLLLRRAALCISHAGLNTALESLSAGVPMVAIPVSHDQPGVAARIAYTGSGVVIPFAQLKVPRLRRAVEDVLATSSYRENAVRLQAAIKAAHGGERAAEIIDQVLRAALIAGARPGGQGALRAVEPRSQAGPQAVHAVAPKNTTAAS